MKKRFIKNAIFLFLLCVSIVPVAVHAITYYVRFNPNGGSGTMSNQTFTTDEEKYLSTNTFTRTGYSFIGWNKNSSGTSTWYMPNVKYKNLTSTSGATVNVYAQWMETNQGSMTINGSQAPKDGANNYAIDNHKNFTVQVNVTNGTVSPSSKTIEYYTNATFTINPTSGYGNPTVSCTNSQSGSISGSTLTVANVSNNTTCTVTYVSLDKTTLYTDGTLIINEKASDRTSNIALHGAVTNEYTAMQTTGTDAQKYIFSSNSSQPWYSQRASIKKVEIGQVIQPTSMKFWFYGFTNMEYGDFTNLDTSNVTNMQQVFYQAGYDSSVTSFALLGLDDWDTSQVLNMSYMFYRTGYYATTWSIGDLSNWDTSDVTNMSYMFAYSGYNAVDWNHIGILDVYATNIYRMFQNSSKAKAVLSIYSEPAGDTNGYIQTFYSAATATEALIVVNYSCGNAVIDDIIATKSTNGHVVKGIEFGCSVQNEFPVALDAQGGTIPATSGWTLLNNSKVGVKAYTTNSTYGTLPTPTFRAYPFLGWYTKPEGGTKITSSTTVTKTSGHTLYAHWNIPNWTVNVSVINGTVSGSTSKTVVDYSSPTFNVSTTLTNDYLLTVSCTNNQKGVVTNGVLTVNNVTNNTTCTVTYGDAGKTTLYTDGTLIINERTSDRSSNITAHGAVTNEYEPFSNNNAYSFTSASQTPWNSERDSITRVEIGQTIQPIKTAYWFYGLTKMTYGDFTNLDTSNVISMYQMFYQAGFHSSVTSFTLTGLNNWDTSKVTTIYQMFYRAGYYATIFNIGDLSTWNTSEVTNMRGMFYQTAYSSIAFELDLSTWDTSKVTTMYQMFCGSGHNATIWSIGNLSTWDTSNVTTMYEMFENVAYRTSYLTSIGTLDIYATDIYYMFYGAEHIKATLNIYSEPTSYIATLSSAATADDSLIIVNYNCGNAVIDDIIATKSTNGHVVKGIEFGCSVQNEFPVTLDPEGGTIPATSGWTLLNNSKAGVKTYTTNSTYGTLPTPTFRSYTFLGWYDREEGGTKVTSSTTVTKTSGHTLYAHWYKPSWTVNVSVNNGTVVGASSKTVIDYEDVTFNVSTTLTGYYSSIVNCTNGQTAIIANDELIVSDVTNNTTCTITYSDAGTTVLYTDGTLIINEKASDRSANITSHGSVTNEYEPLYANNAYVFSSNSSQPWNSQKASIKSVEIGQVTQPTNTAYWFYGLNKMMAGDFTNLDMSNVTGMYQMFYTAGNSSTVTAFNLTGLNNWNISNVKNMASMFSSAGEKATTWNIGDLSNWNTSQVTSMASMFSSAGKNATTWNIGDLSDWNTSQVTNMGSMFSNAGATATTFNIGSLSGWDTSKVTTMQGMFSYAGTNASTFNIGSLSNWNTSQVTNMASMFSNAGTNASTFNIGSLSTWDTSKVTSMYYMFNQAGRNSTSWNIGSLSNWNTSQVTSMESMFSYAGANVSTFNIGSLSNWNTSQVISMESMFFGAGTNASTFNIGSLSNWNTSQVTSMKLMFSQAGYNASTFNIGSLSSWDVSNVADMGGMFSGAGHDATTWNIGSLSSWNVSNVTDMHQMFSSAAFGAATFNIGTLTNWDTTNVIDMQQMFWEAGWNATTFNTIGTLKVYSADINGIFNNVRRAKAIINILSVPTDYTNAFVYAATISGSSITVNYNCTTIGVINNIVATKSSNSNVAKGSNLEGSCPNRTISVVVNNGTVSPSSRTVANLGTGTFTLTPTSGYGYPTVSCTNNQNGTLSGNTLTVSNVVANTTCTVTYYQTIAINLTDNDATYPWINSSGVWKSGNYNVNNSTSTITSSSFTLATSGSVAFEWAVSSESASYDYLYYTIYKDGTAVSGTGTSTKIGGNNTVTNEADLVYTTVTKELDAGTYTIAFSYRKDSSTHKGLDRGYVKNVRYLN